jgi:hypothetical protein
MKIGLVGDSESGKTSFLAGVYKQYQMEPLPPSPYPKEILEELLNKELKNHVRFRIDNIIDKHKTIENAANMLNNKPLTEADFPPRTTIGDDISFSLTFTVSNIFNKNEKSPHWASINFLDIPGSHLNPKDKSHKDTKKKLISCDSLIVFIDISKFESYYSSECKEKTEHEKLIDRIGEIIKDAFKNPQSSRGILPVSIVFTKSDLVPIERLGDATQLLNDKFSLYLSEFSSNITVLSCPISIIKRNSNKQVFKSFNLHIPFTFCMLGGIFSLYNWCSNKAIDIDNKGLLEKLGLFIINSKELTRYKDGAEDQLKLVLGICDYISIEQILKKSYIYLARDGECVEMLQVKEALIPEKSEKVFA